MRHRVAGKRLGRDTKHRKALRRNLMTELFRHEQIKTTLAKAKAVRSEIEKTITLARNRGDAEALIILAEDGEVEELNRRLSKGQAARLLRFAETGDVDALEQEAHGISNHARRQVAREIKDRDVLQKLFLDIAPRYLNRPGGYTRVVKAGMRKGDAAQMAYLMLVERDEEA